MPEIHVEPLSQWWALKMNARSEDFRTEHNCDTFHDVAGATWTQRTPQQSDSRHEG